MSVVLARAFDGERQVSLPTSKLLTAPTPGRIGILNGFAAAVAISPNGRYAAFLNDGFGSQANGGYQSIAVLNLASNQLTDFPDLRLAEKAHQSYFLGLAFSGDGRYLFASMGSITDAEGKRPGDTGNGIAVYSFREGKIAPERFIKIPAQKLDDGKTVSYALRKTPRGTAIPYPAGLAVIAEPGKNDKLLVANNLADNAILVDSATGRVINRFDLSLHPLVPSSYPYTVIATKDGKRAWCSLWNESQVAELDLQKGTVTQWIDLDKPKDATATGSHPTALLLSPDEKRLYVALSNEDEVAVVSTPTGKRIATLDTAPADQKFAGSYPNALAQSEGGKQLFVADAAINAVAVFDVSHIEGKNVAAQGFIPTEWYPSALAIASGDLLIATSKGEGTGPNNFRGHTPHELPHHGKAYIATLLYGSVARLKLSEISRNLNSYTRTVEADNRFNANPGKIQFASGSNPIRHVIYIIKENRTYDQILGDLPVGNGDPSLVMYGADVTPNQHKIAMQFGVLDNFYDSGEVSGDGHEWSTAAIASDYNEKTWQIDYRGDERTYDYQGEVADEIPRKHGVPDVDAPQTGYLWDDAADHGLSYRDYGEFISTTWCRLPRVKSRTKAMTTIPPAWTAECSHPTIHKGEALPPNVGDPHGSPSPWPWAVPVIKFTEATKGVLRGHYDENFPDFNLEYPDQFRGDEFLNEFEGFVRAREQGKGTELPAFVLLYLPDDHTQGTTPGSPRPAASVADNDLAVGRVVEAVSHSPYWDDTAIFIVEDDAQNGADHVDAHRSTAYVISKFSPGSSQHPFVDHRFYTTVNMVHTIEVLLGLPPMNQNDAYAPVMSSLFTGAGDQHAFTADWKNRDDGLIYQMNPSHGEGSRASARMDFSHADAANADILNAILWRDRKGNTPMPKPKHTVFPPSPDD